MRKKILSVLLALCMVLALLPVAAFAAKLTDDQVAELKAKGYTDAQIEEIQKQIATYESDEVVLVFDNTTIDQAENRLVLVVGKCDVEVNAALSTGIVVAPGAADAKVAIKAGADVNAVVVLDKAEVVVEKDAKAASVTVAAAEASVTVAGEVSSVAVTEAAEKASVTVAEGATVASVEVAAPEAKAEIAGTVESVTVAETAKGAETTVSGTVTNVTVAAPDTKTDVANGASVGSVTVGEKATGTEINAADGATVGEVSDPAGNNTGNTAAPEPSPSPSASPAPTPAPTPAPADPAGPDPVADGLVVPAPVVDAANPSEYPYTSLEAVNSANGNKVTINVTGLGSHENGAGTNAYWVGVAIPMPAANEAYTLVVLKTDKTTGKATGAVTMTGNQVPGSQMNAQNIKQAVADENYQCIYFGSLSGNFTQNYEIVAVKDAEDATAIKGAFGALVDKTAALTAADEAATAAENELASAQRTLEQTMAQLNAATTLKNLMTLEDPTEAQLAQIAQLKATLELAVDADITAVDSKITTVTEAKSSAEAAVAEKTSANTSAQTAKDTAAEDLADAQKDADAAVNEGADRVIDVTINNIDPTPAPEAAPAPAAE